MDVFENPKIRYFLRSAKKALLGKGLECPSCGNRASRVVDRKYLVTALHRCRRCSLQFRAPTTSAEEQAVFYQEEYRQGFTTDLPDEDTLRAYLECRFRGTEKDYASYLDVLDALGAKKGARLFDFGCSWGYGSWQLQQHGFSVESYEISGRRADFARDKLGVHVHSSLPGTAGTFDVFFSAHVLEHVPSVRQAIEFAFHILRPGGLFVAFTPNGSLQLRRRRPEAWHKLWGFVHPNFLDEGFYRAQFAGQSFIVSSSPYDLGGLRTWANLRGVETAADLGGDELLCAAYK